MKVPWKKIFGVGKAIGLMAIPGFGTIVEAIEAALPGFKGTQKKDAALKLATSLIEGIEEFKGIDINEKPIQDAIVKVNDAYVAARNAESALRSVLEQARAKKADGG